MPWTLVNADASARPAVLADRSVRCIVTSPLDGCRLADPV